MLHCAKVGSLVGLLFSPFLPSPSLPPPFPSLSPYFSLPSSLSFLSFFLPSLSPSSPPSLLLPPSFTFVLFPLPLCLLNQAFLTFRIED